MISSYSITFLKFIKWLLLPSNLVLRKLIPVLYALLLQVVTGIPKPDALEKFDVTAFTIKFSEKIHDYPYWLQDLSHLPLFFIFTWLAHWFFTPNDGHNSVKVKAVSTSIFYAIFNEGIQAIIPDRFAKNAMKGPSELISALQKLYRENLSHPLPHQFLVFFHYSHPTFFERKEALEKD